MGVGRMSEGAEVQQGNQLRANPTNHFLLTAEQTDFPEKLLADPKGPTRLWGRGNPAALGPGVAIIGARNATPYGVEASRAVARWAADRGVTVYSGAARGCDQAAHRAALDAGGATVAVLGCGPDRAYPANARGLLDEMCERGAVIAPFEWGTPPSRYRFVVRNRVIAALASLVVVTEGRIPSGTFSTVTHATELGTSVAAVPGSIFSGYADAPNRLIADGATVITCPNDLYTALDLCLFSSLNTEEYLGGGIRVSERDRPIVEALQAQPMSVTMLAETMAISAAEAGAVLERLTVDGTVTRFRDGCYMVLARG